VLPQSPFAIYFLKRLMRSTQLQLEKYDTDKVANRYLEQYDPVFEQWVDKQIILLELGVYKGGSLLLWHDYFPQATVVGIDIKLPKDFTPTDRIKLFEGDQTDRKFLDEVAEQVAPHGFDIIIDDASHLGTLTKISFWHLFDYHLKHGGIYAIEDWGTGYWDDWPDGQSFDLEEYNNLQQKATPTWIKIAHKFGLKPKTYNPKTPFPCHSFGMVGFIKQLVDEMGANDATRKRLTGNPERNSKFKSLLIVPSIVFVKKAG